MSDRPASSSDLEYARRLSRQLVEGGGSPGDCPPGPGFTRFAPSMVARAAEPAASPPTTLESWDDLLEWAVEHQPADAAFVVDPEGFVIANRGRLDHSELEGLGPQFQELAAMASRIEAGTARVVSLKLDRGWITGIRFDRGDHRFFLVGFIASEPLSTAAEQCITAQVEHNLSHL